VAPWIVLGSAMAHEIGHMLLSGRHSQQGVMRASFNQADFRRIAAGDLAFTDSEAAGIRARMSIRDAYVHTTGLCERPLFMRAVDCPTTPAFTGLPHAGLR
jgi:hypothetical protein